MATGSLGWEAEQPLPPFSSLMCPCPLAATPQREPQVGTAWTLQDMPPWSVRWSSKIPPWTVLQSCRGGAGSVLTTVTSPHWQAHTDQRKPAAKGPRCTNPAEPSRLLDPRLLCRHT